MQHPLANDLSHVLAHTGELWDELRGSRIFVTGGTGFFGKWLLESFVWANDHLHLDAKALVLTRDPRLFAEGFPILAGHPCLAFHRGDVRDFEFPEGQFLWVVHAATPASVVLTNQNSLEMSDIIVQGTRRVLDFAVTHGAQKFLLTSSGAVYGQQPCDMTHIPEEYVGSPDTMNPRSAYGESKRMAEWLCSAYASQQGLAAKIARCFAFVGPYLPLDGHFAIGNFIRDALAGGPIVVKGDGSPRRSYLYAADLVIWLWTVLVRGDRCRPYNVGSDRDLTIGDLAREVASVLSPGAEIQIAESVRPDQRPLRYVPMTKCAEEQLGLRIEIGLSDAIERTGRWWQGQ